jgi:Homeodomain
LNESGNKKKKNRKETTFLSNDENRYMKN